MSSRRQFVGILLGGAIALARPAVASIAPAESYVRDIADEVMGLANSGVSGTALRDKFAALLNRHINLKGIANYALGTWQSRLPDDKRDELYRLVNNYAAALFVYYVDDFRGDGLEVNSTTTQGKYTIIMTAIKLIGGGREQVRWRLLPAAGGFKVTDVNVKGVWLTISMKDRFSKVLARSKGDFEALFEELREAETW